MNTTLQRQNSDDFWALLRHDLEKPRAAVEMFLSIAPKVANDPHTLATWHKELLKSFRKVNERISSIENATCTSKLFYRTMKLEGVRYITSGIRYARDDTDKMQRTYLA